MKRRDFLKLLGIAPFAPSVLAAKENPLMKVTRWDAATKTLTMNDDGLLKLVNFEDYTICFKGADLTDSCSVFFYSIDANGVCRRIPEKELFLL